MEWFAFIILLFVGALCIFIGFRIWKKEQITLIHDYHYTKVSKKVKKAYTEKMGKGMIVMGTGIFLTGVINLVSHSGAGWVAFGIGFIAGIIMIIQAQMKYNHGIF